MERYPDVHAAVFNGLGKLDGGGQPGVYSYHYLLPVRTEIHGAGRGGRSGQVAGAVKG